MARRFWLGVDFASSETHHDQQLSPTPPFLLEIGGKKMIFPPVVKYKASIASTSSQGGVQQKLQKE
jgi:hypothetical protein